MHRTIRQCLLTILAEYGARFALYVAGLYEYDNNKYANINEDALTAVTEELGKAAEGISALEQMNGISDLGADSSIRTEETYISPIEDEIREICSFRDGVGEYEQTAYTEPDGLKELTETTLQIVTNLQKQGIVSMGEYIRENPVDFLTENRLRHFSKRAGASCLIIRNRLRQLMPIMQKSGRKS